MPYPYPTRPNVRNGYQIAGQAIREGAGVFEESKQAKMRRELAELTERRQRAILDRQVREDEQRRAEWEKDHQIRKEKEAREAAAAAGQKKEWVPTTPEEKEAWYRKQKEIDFEYEQKKTKPMGEGERTRQEKARQARASIPAVWSRIESHRQNEPKENDPKYAEASEMAVANGAMDGAAAGARLYRQDLEAWRSRVRQDLDELNRNEVDAGLPATRFPLGNQRIEDLESYRLYRSGGAGGQPGAPAAPAAPAAPMNEDAAAEAWLQANPTHPAAPGVRARLAKRKGGNGL